MVHPLLGINSLRYRARMGDISKKNLALEIKLFKNFINRIGLKVVTTINIHTRNKWCVSGAYLSFSCVLSLGGNESFIIEVKQLIKHLELKKGLVWIILSGMVKGQKTPMLQYLCSVPVTGSGIDIKKMEGQTSLYSSRDRHKWRSQHMWQQWLLYEQCSYEWFVLDNFRGIIQGG